MKIDESNKIRQKIKQVLGIENGCNITFASKLKTGLALKNKGK